MLIHFFNFEKVDLNVGAMATTLQRVRALMFPSTCVVQELKWKLTIQRNSTSVMMKKTKLLKKRETPGESCMDI